MRPGHPVLLRGRVWAPRGAPPSPLLNHGALGRRRRLPATLTGVGSVIRGPKTPPPRADPSCSSPLAGQGARRAGWGGQGSPWPPPGHSSESGVAAATLRGPGAVSQQVGEGRAGGEEWLCPSRLRPLSLLCPPPGSAPLSRLCSPSRLRPLPALPPLPVSSHSPQPALPALATRVGVHLITFWPLLPKS